MLSLENKDESLCNVYKILSYLKFYKYPLLITFIFFLSSAYVSFVIDDPARGSDALYYYFAGKQILFGDRDNVIIPNAPIGGPVLFALTDLIFNNAFLTIKIISLLSGIGIVYLSYFIIRNVFSSQVALAGQLIFAINPFLHFQTIFPFNEMFPLLLIFISFFYITKKRLESKYVALAGLLLGFSFMFRYQAILVFAGFFIFTLISYGKKKNLFFVGLIVVFFLIGSSPLLFYNYTMFGKFIDGNPAFYLLVESVYQTSEWKNKLEEKFDSLSTFDFIFIDLELFLKNYFYNLFYHNPNRIFSFTFNIENLSPTPIIPFLGILLIIGGFVYSLKINLRRDLIILLITTVTSTILIFVFGDFKIHFFAIIIIPLIFIGIFSINKIEKNYLPLLISPLVFFLIISIVPINRPDYLFSIWITFPMLTSIFVLEVLPKIISRNKKHNFDFNNSNVSRLVVITIISLLIVMNIGFSYKFMNMILFGDKSFDGIEEEIQKIFYSNESRQLLSEEAFQIGNLLAKQPEIQKSYVMTSDRTYSYYANSKTIYVSFNEGPTNQTVESYMNRSNWSTYEYFVSNIGTNPIDRNDVYKAVPDYLIYNPNNNDESHVIHRLKNPNDPKIPSNFEVLYQSNRTGIIVYKIHH